MLIIKILKIILKIYRDKKKKLIIYLFKIKQKTKYKKEIKRINLCSANIKIPGYFNIDISEQADLSIDLAKDLLPMPSLSIDSLVCVSAINYFKRERTVDIVRDVYRVLVPGGIARFGVQDLEKIAYLYVNKDKNFFFQKNNDGNQRFEGETIGDKFVAWFYGYISGGYPSQYFYDYESLSNIFKTIGFSIIEKKAFMDSRLQNIALIDNRADQMFFLEAIK